ncbi:MAG: hypothetical protein RLZZ337_868, partial [Bacteroidota bacterium]
MPVKNAEPYLRPCLESIASQSNADWELIAVNDGSEDRSETILLEFASNRPNVQVINNKGTGIVDALKLAYAYYNGDYVHRMDA